MSEVVAAVVLDGIIDAAGEEGAIIAKSSGVEKDKNDDKDVLVVEKNGTKEDVREKPKDRLDGPKEKQEALVGEKDGVTTTTEDVREKQKDGLDGPKEKQEADEKADGLSKSDEKADGLSKSDQKADGLRKSDENADVLIKPDEKDDELVKDDEKVAELDKDDEKEKSILPEETSDDVDQKKGKDSDNGIVERGLEEADSPAVTARSVPTSNNSRPHNNGEEIVFIIDDDDDEEEDGVENDEPIFLGFKRSRVDARNYEGKKMKLAKKATEDATDGDDTETS